MLASLPFHHRTGRYALMLSNNKSLAYKHLAIQLAENGRFQEALAVCKQACEQNSEDTEAWFLLGAINGQLGFFSEAEICCRHALELQPGHAGLHYNLSIALLRQDKVDEAIAGFEETIRLNPHHAEAYHDLGNAAQMLGRVSQAISNYQQAIQLQPTLVAAHNNLGNAYRSNDRLDDAAACYLKALELMPDFAMAYSGLASVYFSRLQYGKAIELLRQAVTHLPDVAEIHFNLGIALRGEDEHEPSLSCFRKALSLNPDYVEARWALTISQIPAIYGPSCTPAVYRSKFIHEISDLEAWLREKKLDHAYQAVGNQLPFFLAYQEENNRDLLSKHGALCTQLMNDWRVREGFPTPSTIQGGPVRVGVVSAQIRDHSVWNTLVKGWLQHLDRNRFELYTFHTNNNEDKETAWARAHSTFFAKDDRGLRQWVETILGNHPDILIYPEIGLDPMTAKLASLRLAPVQVASWGHPETTGLPTIDYYLSSDAFEPPESQDYYSEQLIRLPHLGCHYHPLQIVPSDPDFTELGIDLELPLLICPGMPFKYAPQYDRVFVEIARTLGKCQFVFFHHHRLGRLSIKLRQRLGFVFNQAGLEFDNYVKFIPWLARPKFYGLMKHADVFLDTIGFSGFNTVMQAVECDLPIVTKEGAFLRGRFASGILRRIGVTELIAKREDDYVNLVVKLIRDSKYRRSIQQRIAMNRYRLFDDLTPVHALETFLIDVARRH